MAKWRSQAENPLLCCVKQFMLLYQYDSGFIDHNYLEKNKLKLLKKGGVTTFTPILLNSDDIELKTVIAQTLRSISSGFHSSFHLSPLKEQNLFLTSRALCLISSIYYLHNNLPTRKMSN